MSYYLSFVVAARNDNYGGNFLHRMQGFVNVLLPLLAKYRLDAELIIVEWNPPSERARLEEAIIWPHCQKEVSVRIIEVPCEIHRKLPNSAKLPMFEYIAKNVGIRRSRAKFVLATNPDVLFSEEFVTYLASNELSKDNFYRIDRYDFNGLPSLGVSVEAALLFAKRHVYQVHTRGDDRKVMPIKIGPLRRWYGILSGKWPGSHNGHGRLRSNGGPLVPLDDDKGLYGGIHTNASGDFLLASFESWAQMKGFPEFTDTFTHLDSYGCHQLKALGLKQMLFQPPCMMLHGDHTRAEQKSRPVLLSKKWENDLKQIREGLLGPAINGESWGLAEEELLETVLY